MTSGSLPISVCGKTTPIFMSAPHNYPIRSCSLLVEAKIFHHEEHEGTLRKKRKEEGI
jgi:hypothetical protein